jgi:hypothetical protein
VKDDIIKQKVKESYGKIALVGSSSEVVVHPANTVVVVSAPVLMAVRQ